MSLSNIPNDILELIFKFLSENDKLNLFKTNKNLIYKFKFDDINIQLKLSHFSQLTDNDLSYLTGVHTINLCGCNKITDQGLKYLAGKPALTSGKLKGVHTINLSQCNKITDQGLQYLAIDVSTLLTGGKLKGVHTIDLSWCNKITDQGLKYLAGKPALTSGKLKGVHTINLSQC